MLRINIDVEAGSEQRWGDVLERIGRALAGRVSEMATTPAPVIVGVSAGPDFQGAPPAPRPRGRPPKASADPVAAYVEKAGGLPEAVVESDPAPAPVVQSDPAPAPVVTTLEQDVTAAETALQSDPPAPQSDPAPVMSLDELRAKVRDVAQSRGALWLRPLLLQDKATKVSELTEATMRAALEVVS